MEEGRMAWLYDALFGPILHRVQRKVVEMVKKHGCRNILDMGCGTGMQCSLLRKNGLDVAGIDINPYMLFRARKKGLECIRGDIAHLSFPSSTFDCALLSFVFHLNDMASIRKIADEARRVVREGGGIIIADYGAPRGRKGRMLSRFVKMVERMAAEEHHRNYKRYEGRGYMEGIIEEFNLPVVERAAFYHGNIEVVMLRNV